MLKLWLSTIPCRFGFHKWKIKKWKYLPEFRYKLKRSEWQYDYYTDLKVVPEELECTKCRAIQVTTVDKHGVSELSRLTIDVNECL